MNKPVFCNRDISWLSFNERVLEEAARETVPLMERFNFLAIYSSNLDEFYRVRFPLLVDQELLNKVTAIINRQLARFPLKGSPVRSQQENYKLLANAQEANNPDQN